MGGKTLRIRTASPRDAGALRGQVEALLAEASRDGPTARTFASLDLILNTFRERCGVVVFCGQQLLGFGIARAWEDERFVSHPALVVASAVRERGVGAWIKEELIALSHQRWPKAQLISISMSPIVERLNKGLAYETVPYCDLTTASDFWDGCSGCEHESHLKRNQFQDCHCWAGLRMPPGRKRDRVVPKDALR